MGYGNCTTTSPDCETLLDTKTNCGACGTTCGNYQSCAAAACSPRYVGTAFVGGANYDLANGVAMAADGSYFVVGYFQGSQVNFGTAAAPDLQSSFNQSEFLSKYSVSGQHQWTKVFLNATNNGNSTAVTNWYTGASGDGWTVSSSSGYDLYTITRDLGNNMGTYSVYLTNTTTGPAILSIGKVTCKNSLMGADSVSRKILVNASSSSAFPGALTVKSTINMAGNNVTIDSYDSTDNLHSYWPTYPLAPGYGTYTNTGSSANMVRKANGKPVQEMPLLGAL